MRYALIFLVGFLPHLAYGGWDDFKLYWKDGGGRQYWAVPTGAIGDLKKSEIAGELLEAEMNLVGGAKNKRTWNDLGSCVFSFEHATMDCSKAKGVLAGSHYKATWIESPNIISPKDVTDLKRHFHDQEYTRLAYAFRCTLGCKQGPKIILFYWHRPPI